MIDSHCSGSGDGYDNLDLTDRNRFLEFEAVRMQK